MFQLGISAVDLAPQGQVEVFISHAYPGESAPTPADRVQLCHSEAEGLAGELLAIVAPGRPHQT